MAVVFGQRMLGGPNLPTGIDEIRTFGATPCDGLLSATAYRRTLGPSSMTTDIVFTDDCGQRVAELLGAALSNQVQQVIQFAKLLPPLAGAAFQAARAALAERRAGTAKAGAPGTRLKLAPPTPFNASITNQRAFAA